MFNSAKYLDDFSGRFVSRTFLVSWSISESVLGQAGIPEGTAQAIFLQEQLVTEYLIVTNAWLG
jgi:hypothetical protein